jgi:uncharacterized protein (DUF2141 family)
MRTIYLFTALNLFLITNLFAQSYTIEFEIKEIKNDKGLISAALFHGEENFPKKELVFMESEVEAKKGNVKLQFKNVPPGEYAMVVIHDENKNNDLDRNFIGIPKEGIAFSNNKSAKLSAPKYKYCKFRVQGNYYSTVFMKY